MIISASRRTDIPAFYSRWFEHRIEEGFLYVRNPINRTQVSKIDLDPSVVDCIVFWTKNPIPMMDRLELFNAYPYYFQFSLTGYGRDIESNLPDKVDKLITAFKQLADKLGSERVIWRYDPILFTDKYTPQYHLHAVDEISRRLEGYTEKCVISFVDVYARNASAISKLGVRDLDDRELMDFAGQLADIVGARKMAAATCAETMDLSSVGIEHNCCIDAALVGSIAGGEMKVGKDKSQRPECGCAASIDIGTYNTCANGCAYCYANFEPESVKSSMKAYDWRSPILCDELSPDDKIYVREMKALLKKGWGDGSLFKEA